MTSCNQKPFSYTYLKLSEFQDQKRWYLLLPLKINHKKIIHSNITGGSPQIVTVTDPKTGKPVQQIIQTKIDPKTGKPVQVVSKVPANAQVVTVTDPDTGQPVQMMVDPKTGKKVPLQNPGAANPAAGPGSNTQIVMVNDPVTGQKVPQVVQTVVDPKTGRTMQVPVQTTAPGGANSQIVTVTDPKTGKPVQQIVQTVIDPATGKPTQVMTPLSNTQNGNLIISHMLLHIFRISDLPWANYFHLFLFVWDNSFWKVSAMSNVQCSILPNVWRW